MSRAEALPIDPAELGIELDPADLALGLEVQHVLNAEIRPLLNIDAGDAEIESVVGGHVTIRLLGACSRCAFRHSCAVYTVLDRVEAAIDDDRASFEVADVRVNREAARMGRRPADAAMATEVRR